MEHFSKDFPSNESVGFCMCSGYFCYRPDDNRPALVAAAEESIHLYRFLGRCQTLFFGVVLQ